MSFVKRMLTEIVLSWCNSYTRKHLATKMITEKYVITSYTLRPKVLNDEIYLLYFPLINLITVTE